MTDYPALMAAMLDDLGVMYSIRSGWQKIHCPNGDFHSRGDRVKSCSYNYYEGVMKCHACDLSGGFVAVAKELGYESNQTSKNDDTDTEEPTFIWR